VPVEEVRLTVEVIIAATATAMRLSPPDIDRLLFTRGTNCDGLRRR
jgi:hypothetical protein